LSAAKLGAAFTELAGKSEPRVDGGATDDSNVPAADGGMNHDSNDPASDAGQGMRRSVKNGCSASGRSERAHSGINTAVAGGLAFLVARSRRRKRSVVWRPDRRPHSPTVH
jgi:hypothetical protein